MKKYSIIGMVVIGITFLAMVNVNLSNKYPNVSGVLLKNMEAITQENQEDWHPGECHTEADSYVIASITVWNNGSLTTHSNVDVYRKRCAPADGDHCEYGSKYYSHYHNYYIAGDYQTQLCQG
jgi:hypothetical protein